MARTAEQPLAEPGSGGSPGRFPDFFLVGHPKTGTTALYEMLRQQPAVFMPDLKEPQYFATDLRMRFQRPAAGALPTELADYLALFAPADPAQLVGEASSSYLRSEQAAENIARVAPGAKIVAILREPASFLRSLHLQLLQNHIESCRSLRRALALEPARREGRRIPRRSIRPQALLYSEYVRYVAQLQRYEQRFPPEQLLVLIYDDFRAENQATLQRVLDFLGVRGAVPARPTEANPTVRVRSQELDDLVHRVSVGRDPVSRAAKATIKALTPAGLRRRALRGAQQRLVLGPAGAPDERLMAELRARYAGEVVALSEHLGRDLTSLWGYDELV